MHVGHTGCKCDRAYRRELSVRRKKRLCDIIDKMNRNFVGRVEVIVVGERVCEYIRHPNRSVNQRRLKRSSGKFVRKHMELSRKGNGYRRVFDYHWKLH